MKKSLFSVPLYREGLRQLKAIGIVQAVLLTAVGALPVVSGCTRSLGVMLYDLGRYTVTVTQMWEMLYIGMLVFAPLYVLYLFRFLTARGPSDFYHSLPQSRPCIALSFLSSAATWYAVALVIPALFVYAVWAMATAPSAVLPGVGQMASMLLGMLLGGIAVMAAALCAVSLSGRMFTALCALALFWFAPRLIITVLVQQTLSHVRVMGEGQLNWFLQNPNIAAFGDPLRPVSWAYTAALGALYLGLGIFFFTRRPSEAAGSSAVSRGMQTVTRLSVSFLFCLPAIWSMYVLATSSSSSAAVWPVTVSLTAALIVYFLFELITTRKPKNLIRAIPWLGVLAGAVTVCVAVMTLYTSAVWSYEPKAGEVDAVALENADEDTNNPYWRETIENSPGAHARLTDEPSRQTVCRALSAEIAENRSAGSGTLFSGILFFDDLYDWGESHEVRVTVTLWQGDTVRQRVVTLSEDDVRQLLEKGTPR